MKKYHVFLLLMVLLLPFAAKADDIVIGTGNSWTATSPFNNRKIYSWNECIYSSANFASSCVINKVGWSVGVEGIVRCETMKIYMGERSSSNFASTTDWTPENDLELVYSGGDLIIGEYAGWVDFTLDQPFIYEKEGNLVIVVVTSKDMSYGGPAMNYTKTGNCNLYRAGDDPNYTNYPDGAGTRGYEVPNIKLSVTPTEISCHKALAIAVTNTTQNELTIEWTPYEGSSAFDVYCGTSYPTSTTTPTATAVTNTNHTFTRLAHSTLYYLAVRTNCGDGDVTSWKVTKSMTDPNFMGEGTEENPFLVYSTSDIESINSFIANGWSTKGKWFKMMRDIDERNPLTVPIGNGKTFEGSFDFNNKTINVNISRAGYAALISAATSGAVIKDVTVTGTINCNGNYCAGIVGCIDIFNHANPEDVYITNCINKAELHNSGNYTAGIIAYFKAPYAVTLEHRAKLHITNCHNYSETITGQGQTAGLIGYCMANAIIENCSNTADLSVRGTSGGLIGGAYDGVEIRNCFNRGNVTASLRMVGGIVGNASSGVLIENTYNLGDVNAGDNFWIGGLIGYSSMNASMSIYGSGIRNCYNAGTVTGGMMSGGLIGQCNGSPYVLENIYYREGIFSTMFGVGGAGAVNVVSFTQDETVPTTWNLAQEVGGTTDLLEALNNFADENEGFDPFYTDIYGYNNNYPTLDQGKAPGIELTPENIAMGYRPIGAAMHGEKTTLTYTGVEPITISEIEMTGNGFVKFEDEYELPITLQPNATFNIRVTTDPDKNITPSNINETVAVIYHEGDRSATVAHVTATAYTPTTPDVVEHAQTLASTPTTITQSTSTLYDNYNLPGNKADGADAVYKLTFTNDILFNAEMTDGMNAKVALYREDLEGESYPNETNYWDGPEIGQGGQHGPGSTWIHYDNGIYMTSIGAQGPVYWGIMFPAGYLADYDGYGLTKVQMFDVFVGNCTLNIYKGGDNAPETLIATEAFVGIGNNDWREISISNPPTINDDENLWITFYGDGTTYPIPASPYVGDLNSNWISSDGESWNHATDYGMNYSWMIRGYADNGSRSTEVELPAFQGGKSIANYSCKSDDQYLVTNPIGERSHRDGYPESYFGTITNATVPTGTYYLVASSTSPEFTLNINPTAIPAPLAPTIVFPQDEETSVSTATTFEWELGQFTTEYQFLLGSTYPPTTVIEDWTTELHDRYFVSGLLNNTNYFYQINERNSSGTTYGPIIGFTTTFYKPSNLQVDNTMIYEGDNAELTWNPVPNQGNIGYNIYKNDELIGNVEADETSYSVEGLTYNMEGYYFNVTAVYAAGESDMSNRAYVKVTGNGTVSGTVFEQDGTTGIGGATVTFEGRDEFDLPQTFTLMTGTNGEYSGDILAGVYYIKTNKEGYQESIYHGAPRIVYNETKPNLDFLMLEIYTPVNQVVAEEIDNTKVRVSWSYNNTRTFQYFKVYRDNCYATSEETAQLLASNLTSMTYDDTTWGDAEAGVYKWGVAAVYEGNRETEIRWSEPSENVEMPSTLGITSDDGNRQTWDLMISFETATYSQTGIVTDGNFIYASKWNGVSPIFFKYDLDGNFIESFDIEGAIYGVRDLTYDGNCYFYGSTGDNFIYKLDFTNRTLVETITCPGLASRHLTYDPDNNGLWSGNWTTLTLYALDGSIIRTAPIPSNAYGSGYYVDENGEAHLYMLCVPNNNDAKVYDYNITTNTMGEEPIFDAAANIPGAIGFAGGAFIGEYNGKIAFFASIQQDPNLVGIFEITDAPAPTPGDTQSIIAWSSCIDKDMMTTLDVNVATNSGEAPTGTVVNFTNISEPEMGYNYYAVMDESGTYSWDEFRKGSYILNITLNGFNSGHTNDTIEIIDATTIDCILEEVIAAVNLYVSPTGWATWNTNTGGSTPTEGWLYYDNGINTDAVGLTGGGSFYWGIMIPAYQLADYEGTSLTKVALYDYIAHTGKILIYEGGTAAPGTLVRQDSYYCNGTADFIRVDLSTPLELDVTQNLWIVLNNDYGQYVAAVCDDTGDANGRWISADGTNWFDMVEAGLYNTWMIRGFVTDQVRGERTIGDIAFENNATGGTFAKAGVANGKADNRSIVEYKVKLDGVFVDNTTTPYYQFDAADLFAGETYTTSVAAVYSTGISEWTDYQWIYTPCDEFVGTTSYEAEAVEEDVVLTWTLPEGDKATTDGEWYYYDNGTCTNNIGAGGSVYWGIMLPAGSYTGTSLSKVMIYANQYTTGTFYMTISSGGDDAPGTQLYTENFSIGTTEQYVEHTLTNAVTVDPTQNLWITFYSNGATYPASSSDYTGDLNGTWVSVDGTQWMDIMSASGGAITCTWMIRTFIEENAPAPSGDILGVMLWRDGELLTETPLTTTTYTDHNPGIGTFNYCIKVVYDGELDITYYAMSCEDCEDVTIEPQNIGENDGIVSSLYPNPTKDEVIINAVNMQRIIIVNALGQVIYNQTVGDDETTLHLGNYEAGMYMIIVVTENGTSTKRVTLVR